MTPAEFAPIAAYLSASVGKPMGREQAEVYYDLLRDLDGPLVAWSVRRAVAESRYPTIPPVGVIRAIATEAQAERLPTWPEAWALALRAVAIHGLGRSRDALDSLPACVRDAVEAIGYRALCDAPESGLEALRAQFRDAYGIGRDREERGRLLPAHLRQELGRLVGEIGRLPEGGRIDG